LKDREIRFTPQIQGDPQRQNGGGHEEPQMDADERGCEMATTDARAGT
jgi:hypothetical protein